MSSDSGERRQPRARHIGGPPAEKERLPCPRCDSTTTKFCYYNNYNLTQPRHFCKSCRRYWTQGGSLRNIPVGGATRKNSKRSRTSQDHVIGPDHHSITASSSLFGKPSTSVPLDGDVVNDAGNSFTSFLNAQGSGLFAIGGFGDMGIGFGRGGVWPCESGVNMWQLGSGDDDVFVNGGSIAWPELAISTPGKDEF